MKSQKLSIDLDYFPQMNRQDLVWEQPNSVEQITDWRRTYNLTAFFDGSVFPGNLSSKYDGWS